VRYRHLQRQGDSIYSQPKASKGLLTEGLLKGRSPDVNWIPEKNEPEVSFSLGLSLLLCLVIFFLNCADRPVMKHELSISSSLNILGKCKTGLKLLAQSIFKF